MEKHEGLLEKNQIRGMRALAIIGVITAHGTAVPDSFSATSKMVSNIIQSIGCMGVGVFFFLSGYLMAIGNSKNQRFFPFIKKKTNAIVIPWFVSAVLVYMYEFIRKGGSAAEFILSILGYMSSYWFMSVLLMLLILYFFLLKTKLWKLISYVLIISSVLIAGLRWGRVIPISALSVYLNLFNWSIFFSIGVLASELKRGVFDRLFKYRWLFYTFVLCVVACACLNGKMVSYFVLYYCVFEIFVIISTINIGYSLKENKLALWIGDISFALYLWHELPWAGLVRNIGDRFDIAALVPLRPILVLFITCVELKVGYELFKKFNIQKLYCKITGYRE